MADHRRRLGLRAGARRHRRHAWRGLVWIAPGALGVLYTMFGWWTDVIKEAHRGDHTRVVQLHLRYGMIMFIASEVMFFVAWFWAFFDASLFAGEAQQVARVTATGGHWPPAGVHVFDPWHLPFVNTLILLTSGTTVTWAHHALLHNDRKGLKTGLALTIVLGLMFTSIQAYEYAHAAFPFGNGGQAACPDVDLRLDLLHGDRLPRLPRDHRHDLPDRLPVAGDTRRFQAGAAFRLRGRRLVLAFRRRGLALPFRLHLRVGLVGRGRRRVGRKPADRDGGGQGALPAAGADLDRAQEAAVRAAGRVGSSRDS